jgi:flagellin-like protein
MKINIRIFNKKAVSPLIATVLLIAFAIALGSIVMNWGKTYVEEEMESGQTEFYASKECDRDIDIRIKTIGGRPQLCYDLTGTNLDLDFMIYNAGPRTVEGIKVIAYGNRGYINETSKAFEAENMSIAPGQSKRYVVNFTVDSGFTSLAQVEFIAYLNTTGTSGPTLCTKNALIKTGSDFGRC